MRFLRRKRGDRDQDAKDLLSLAEQVMDEPFWKRPTGGSEFQAPPLDLSESNDDYLIELEVPGLDPDQLNITVSDRTLTIKGEKERITDQNSRDYHRVERRFGTFTRQVHLPEMAREDNVEAEYERGVLRISIPKSTASSTREIEVNIREG